MAQKNRCGYCNGIMRFWQRKSFCKRFHWSCGFILENNGKDLDKYIEEKQHGTKE